MAEFGQKEVSAPQKAKSPEERKKKIIIIALIVLGVLAVLFGVKKIAVANKAVKAIRSEYLVTSGVEGVYIEHYTLGLDNVYVVFNDGKNYVCHVRGMNTVEILYNGMIYPLHTRSNYPYGTGEEKTKLYESMASRIKEHGLPIAPVFVIGS